MGARSTAARPWLCPMSICTDPVCVCVYLFGVLRDCSVECIDYSSEGFIPHKERCSTAEA